LGLAVEPFQFEPEVACGFPYKPHCTPVQWPRVARIIAGVISVSRCSSSASKMSASHGGDQCGQVF
jgi:hypothetical protein